MREEEEILMGCLIAVILVAILAIPLFVIVLLTLSRTKKEARNIIASGHISDLKKTNKVMKILAGFITDMEAKDLWHKLQTLKDKEKIV